MIEVLAPCGAPGALEAAVRSGADAVYLGMGKFNARQNAENFSADSLKKAVGYCHSRNVRVHLTLNTLAFDDELLSVEQSIREAAACGVDAIIVQDLGIARMIKTICPSIPIHGSTQLSIHTKEGAKLLEDLGFSRVVLARELSLEEIKEIAGSTSLEIEAFIHGALCMSLSGQCELSALIGGRSGNRGLCAQPCRLPFAVKGGSGYDLSLKDMSHIERIRDMIDAGVTSFKIEGRMKRPEYVAAATSAVRAAVDGIGPKPEDMEKLKAVFSRSGFTSGYIDHKLGRSMFGTRTKDDVISAAPILKELENSYRKERQSVLIDYKLTLRAERTAELSVSAENVYGDIDIVTVTGDMPALGNDISYQRVEQSFIKTGDTPFVKRNISIDADNGLYLPSAALNSLRREAIAKLLDVRSVVREYKCKDAFDLNKLYPDTQVEENRENKKIYLRFINENSLFKRANEADGIIVPIESVLNNKDIISKYRDKLIVSIPEQLYGKSEAYKEMLCECKRFGVMKGFADNLNGFAILKELNFGIFCGSGLNITNGISAGILSKLGAESITVSFETKLDDVNKLSKKILGSGIKLNLLYYGRLPAMRVRNCPLKNGTSCATCKRKGGYLTDRMNAKFYVRCNGEGSVVYNSCPLYMADKNEKLNGISSVSLLFTDEEYREAEKIFDEYTGKKQPELPKNFTRGLYIRGLQGR